jgi:hypothetical protein
MLNHSNNYITQTPSYPILSYQPLTLTLTLTLSITSELLCSFPALARRWYIDEEGNPLSASDLMPAAGVCGMDPAVPVTDTDLSNNSVVATAMTITMISTMTMTKQ